MTIRFELRTTKKAKGAEMVPLHISVSDGRAFRLTSATVKAFGRTPNEYHRSSTEPSLF